jgi:HSP20 family protein
MELTTNNLEVSHMFNMDEFDDLFQRMSRPFLDIEDIWYELKNSSKMQTFGPYYYGYSATLGPDGRPVIKEYGNIRPSLIPNAENREPLVETIADEKEKTLKVVAEMPGVDKKDIKIEVVGRTINVDAEHGKRKYHAKLPIKQLVDENSVKATYANGILEIKFRLKEEDRPKGKTVTIE